MPHRRDPETHRAQRHRHEGHRLEEVAGTAGGRTSAALLAELFALGTRADAAQLSGFFKCGEGEYGEGDRFLGVRVPDQRALARRFRDLPLPACGELLDSPWHEARLTALFLLGERYARGDAAARQAAVDLYLAKIDRVNNWDLVDASAPHILGAHLLARDRAILREFADSGSLWRRRVAIVSTFAFLRAGDLDDTFALSDRLIDDKRDLIQKACGWMLREAGKRDPARLRAWLTPRLPRLGRTLLRYAIEKFPEPERKAFLARDRMRPTLP